MGKSVAGIVKKDNKYLLGKRKIGGAIGGKWEFPGGKIENNETDEEALKREFIEELDVEISVDKFICNEHFSAHNHDFTLYAYYITLLSENLKNNEHDEFKYFTLSEIKELNDNFAESDKLILKYL